MNLFWDFSTFDAHLSANALTPFAWGDHDCCLFPANAIKAHTGVDLADDFRGKYRTEAEAFALIKAITGGTTVADAAAYCAKKHGLVEYLHPKMAKRGDLVVIKNGDTLIAGVVHCNGKHVISAGPKGLIRLPITTVVRAWAVWPTLKSKPKEAA
jgi:hypothetical protein